MDLNGILLIDKPRNWTSFDVVAKVRGIARQATGIKRPKVGHTGTLDPLATGLVMIVVGSYCKRAQEFSKLDKTYQVTARLGQTSTTGDDEGEKTTISDSQPTHEQIQATVQRFVGNLEQTPPIYSAIKVNGQRAYQMARAGKTVELKPRPVIIYAITEVVYAYPLLSFTVSVSSGTYIRSLVEDIGSALGVGAYAQDLRRVSVGDFTVLHARQIETIQPDTIRSQLQLVEPSVAVELS